jgi:hypothetical protein
MTKETHPLPDAEDRVTRPPQYALELVEYAVKEWNPSPDGTASPEQVHVHFTTSDPELPVFVVRFKSAGELDRFIGALTRHRLGVWPRST